MPPMIPPFGQNPYCSMENEPMVRTVKCGELRRGDFGEEVEIAGRIQNMRMNRFLVLRDETGITQLVAPDEVCRTFYQPSKERTRLILQ